MTFRIFRDPKRDVCRNAGVSLRNGKAFIKAVFHPIESGEESNKI